MLMSCPTQGRSWNWDMELLGGYGTGYSHKTDERASSHFLSCVKEKSHDHNSMAAASRPREEHWWRLPFWVLTLEPLKCMSVVSATLVGLLFHAVEEIHHHSIPKWKQSIFLVDDEDRSSCLGGVGGSHFTDWTISPALNYTYMQSKHIFLNQTK